MRHRQRPAEVRRPPATAAVRSIAARSVAAAALALASAGAPAGAQEPGPRPAAGPGSGAAATAPVVTLELGGFGGAIIPLGDLTRNRFGFNTSLASTGAFGGEGALWHRSGIGAAFEATYSHMDVAQAAGEEGFVVPGGLGKADYVTALWEVRYRYREAGARSAVQPEWGVGAGFRRLDVDPIAEPDLEDSTDLTVSVRAGVFVPLGARWGLKLAVRATRGAYDAGISDEKVTQTDVVIGFGAMVRAL